MRSVVFDGNGTRVLVRSRRVPSGVLVTGELVTGSNAGAMYLRRPDARWIAMRGLPSGGFESPVIATGPASLVISPTATAATSSPRCTDWVTI